MTPKAVEDTKAKRNAYSRSWIDSKPKVYRTWLGMKNRCNNPNAVAYRYYGAKGVKVCERWQKFDNFYADMGDRPSPNHSLDRIDPTGDYEPGNVRWATRSQQSRNYRPNLKSKSGMPGVTWSKKMNKWTVSLTLGVFDDVNKAVEVRKEAMARCQDLLDLS